MGLENLSKIKEVNILHFDFDLRLKRNHVGNSYINHYPVAYINSVYCYYIVANKQPLKSVKVDQLHFSRNSIEYSIDSKLSNGFCLADYVFVGSKKDAMDLYEKILTKIYDRRRELMEIDEKEKATKKYNECLEYVSWYNKKYPN